MTKNEDDTKKKSSVIHGNAHGSYIDQSTFAPVKINYFFTGHGTDMAAFQTEHMVPAAQKKIFHNAAAALPHFKKVENGKFGEGNTRILFECPRTEVSQVAARAQGLIGYCRMGLPDDLKSMIHDIDAQRQNLLQAPPETEEPFVTVEEPASSPAPATPAPATPAPATPAPATPAPATPAPATPAPATPAPATPAPATPAPATPAPATPAPATPAPATPAPATPAPATPAPATPAPATPAPATPAPATPAPATPAPATPAPVNVPITPETAISPSRRGFLEHLEQSISSGSNNNTSYNVAVPAPPPFQAFEGLRVKIDQQAWQHRPCSVNGAVITAPAVANFVQLSQVLELASTTKANIMAIVTSVSGLIQGSNSLYWCIQLAGGQRGVDYPCRVFMPSKGGFKENDALPGIVPGITIMIIRVCSFNSNELSCKQNNQFAIFHEKVKGSAYNTVMDIHGIPVDDDDSSNNATANATANADANANAQ